MQVSVVSGNVLQMLFKQWDSRGNLQCNGHLSSSRPVYIAQTIETGFLGLLSGLPKDLQHLFSDTTQWDTQSSAEEDYESLWDVANVENFTHGQMESRRRGREKSNITVEEKNVVAVLNPTTCLHLGDVILFTVDTQHFPQYDIDNLYNTNTDFDWGAFRQLREEMKLSWTPPNIFSVVFSQPGVFVFTLSSHQHKRMYVRVMPAGGQCYDSGPFFPSAPRHLTRMGISQRRNLLLRPDWLVTGGLLFGAVVILCSCVAVLVCLHA